MKHQTNDRRGGSVKYLSLFSGIEAASVAWSPFGWEPVAFSEIDRFPCDVLKYHYPDVPNWGDITKYKEWPNESVDIIIGGSPCQSFSVAGLRKGLDDPRGNLLLAYLAVVGKYRPKWVVWENVPGVLSSNGGRDFGAFLRGLGQLGYGFAYRVLDAQYAGVPQRRRRIFVVGHLGDWHPAAAVLFELHSLQGHTPPSRKEGKGVARGVEIGPTGGCFTEVNPTLDSRAKDGPIRNQLAGAVVMAHGQGNAEICSDGSPSLTCNHEAPIVAFQQNASGEVRTGEVGYTLNQNSNASGRNTPMIAFNYDQSEKTRSMGETENGCPKLREGCKVAFAQNTRDEVREMEIAGALAAEPGMKQQTYIRSNMQVRRLTPMECERLMGFPDNYTKIPYRNKPADKCPDGPRYKALGNSMAVPVILWIGERIQAVNRAMGA